MTTLQDTARIHCFLERRLVKPLAMFLVLSVASLVGWVAIIHTSWLEGTAGTAPSSRPFLGLQLVDPDERVARMFAFPPGEAVLVDQVLESSPAQRAGLRRGDGIVAVNDRSVRSTTDAMALLEQIKQGEPLKLTVIRGGLVYYLALTLGERTNG